ncbi:carbohydrate ABC transporter permease [Marispirochaeta aestuarii]|uniref:carbohydrate ABC transporter permease n=1 Tax=Marispirochaeta aestuarii TaxID=1963862 RepID=UPI0029C816DE|nr:carbohydrate ABC transporter permease [Marispirochaeta aestuarii]
MLIISSSFKTEKEIFSYPISLIPENATLKNFRALMDNFPRYIFNSFKITISITALQVLTATTAGYALAKLKWPGRGFIFLLYVSSIMIPFQVYIIPQFIIIRSLNLYDTHLALILVSSFTAFGTFLVRQFFMTIPDSYIEAAKINGAHHFYIYSKIVLPLSKPVIATLTILSFRYWWNDLFTALIYIISRERKTLPLGLADFVSEYDVYYGPQMAASLIAIIPVVVLFILAQKYIVQGVVGSGIKG